MTGTTQWNTAIEKAIGMAENSLSKITDATDEELVEIIGVLAKGAGVSVEFAHDAVAYNRLTAIQDAVYRELRSRGPEAPRKIVKLLRHEDVFARLCGATLGMEFAPDQAEKALESIESRPEANARIAAFRVLRLWRSGELKFPLPQHAV